MTVISVSQLNNYVKRFIDSNDLLSNVYIKGEISNFKHHSSGHIYLTLKDAGASLKCVMFSGEAYKLRFVPKDGMKVIALGRVSVYERDGVYQLYINELHPDGKGDLYAAFEQLKIKLQDMGYFDVKIKKPLPAYPQIVGIVTSHTGAALQDILNISSRRYPMCEIFVYPAQVQGPGAEFTIAAGIEYFNNNVFPDVIICGRGGGSIEDLWAFNEFTVADAIYKSEIPVVSAVGHETDFTISDFVADLRAPTPSAAAEMVFPDKNKLLESILNFDQRCKKALLNNINNKKYILDKLNARNIKKNLIDKIQSYYVYIDNSKSDIENSIKHKIELCCAQFAKLCANVDALSPLKILSRGYSVVKNDEKIINSVNDISVNDSVNIVVTDGNFDAIVTNKS